MKIYICTEEAYPVYHFQEKRFYDSDVPREISEEKLNWIKSVNKEHEKTQEFLASLSGEEKWTH